ncbi:hypothetical protein SAMN05216327_1187 [Dyadobacter sp. SG02]|uniref:hypothetical protein n=1 Tax=Dyadobacter sp. SG02 TaxID=1855291 RepID=UPI0008B13861|nr:hypothetical protein [Dyadobacter sp. SG02]SEJ74333.1 hypothetical protein SAMN05216327_1187 [Dyadobacter sp. SG02]
MNLFKKIRAGHRAMLLLIETFLLWFWAVGSLNELVKMAIFVKAVVILAGTLITALAGYRSGIFKILIAILFSTIWAILMHRVLTDAPFIKINPWGGFWLAFTVSLTVNKALIGDSRRRPGLDSSPVTDGS